MTAIRNGFSGLATLLGVAGLAAAVLAAPVPVTKSAATGIAPARVATGVASGFPPGSVMLYDNLSTPATQYYGGQGGNEAIDDLHLAQAGSLDLVEFECFASGPGATFSATVKIYGNPDGLDLAASPLLGTYVVTDIGRGRNLISVPIPGGLAIPADIWVGVEFTDATVGVFLNDTPSPGTSHDIYLENGSFFDFGGSPKANFALRLVDSPYFDLDVTTMGSGSVTQDPDQAAYLGGSTVELTPVPAANWHFVSWGGDAAGTDDPLAVLMDGDKSITATFAIDTYTLTYGAGPGGTIDGFSSQVVDHGSNGTLVTAVPNPGHHFVSWSDAYPTAARTDLNVTANLSVTATFAINVYTLTYSAGPGGAISGTTPQLVDHGADGELVTAVPNPNYEFAGWSDGVLTAARTDLNVTADLAVTATFESDLVPIAGSDFEIGLAGWKSYESGVLTRIAPGRSGSLFAARVAGPNSTREFGINDSPSLVLNTGPAGSRYRVSAWVRSDAGRGAARIRIREYNDGSSRQSVYTPVKTLSASWQELAVEIVTMRANSYFDIQILDRPASTNEVFLIDDIAVEGVPPADRAPVVIAPAALTALAGSVLNVDVTASDPDGNPITTLSASPFAATNPQVFTTSGGNTGGRLAWTPTLAEVGNTYTVTFTAQNTLSGSAITAITVAAPPPPSSNLCGNGTFDADLSGWSRTGDATLSQVAGGRTGSALQLAGRASSSSFGCDDNPNWIATVAGQNATYRFTAWVKSAAHRGKARIRIYEFAAGSQVGSTAYSNIVTLSTTWQKLTLDYAVQSAGSTLSMRVTDSPVSSSTAETFLVDDVSIELVSPPAAVAQRTATLDDAPALEFVRPTVYPNPARREATFALSLARPGALRAELYDVAGRLVRVLANESAAAAGTHHFALTRGSGARLEAGLYFYRAQIADVVHRGRFVVLE